MSDLVSLQQILMISGIKRTFMMLFYLYNDVLLIDKHNKDLKKINNSLEILLHTFHGVQIFSSSYGDTQNKLC